MIMELLNVMAISTEAIRDVDGIYMSLKLLFCFMLLCFEERAKNLINLNYVCFDSFCDKIQVRKICL